jgi:hypothetical protein
MKTRLATLALASALSLTAGWAQAQDDKLSPAVVQQLELVNRLVALGDARKDPVLLLAAASIQKSLGTDNIGLPTQSTAPDAIIARAKAMAGDRKDVQELANSISGAQSKGPTWRIDAVTGRSTYRY